MASNPIPIFGSQDQVKRLAETGEFADYPAQDVQMAARFLVAYSQGSKETFAVYRRDVEKLLHWSRLIANITLPDLVSQDMDNFIMFCRKPPNDWIATTTAPRFLQQDGIEIPNPSWRPFVVKVSKAKFKDGEKPNASKYTTQRSTDAAMFKTLSTFYEYLVVEEYVSNNPVKRIRQKSRYLAPVSSAKTIRRLTDLQLGYLIETATKLADDNPKQERTLFIIVLLFGLYLRISELADFDGVSPTMNNFFRDNDHHWWLRVHGKGNKTRDKAVSDEVLASLKRFRGYLELTPLPSPDDNTPLIPKGIRATNAITSTRQIRRIVQKVFEQAYDNLIKDNLSSEAHELRTATVHWLRHSGISIDVRRRPREHVRDDAGHASAITTDKYIDDDRRARSESAKATTLSD
jgi:site-specific recombinase XerC